MGHRGRLRLWYMEGKQSKPRGCPGPGGSPQASSGCVQIEGLEVQSPGATAGARGEPAGREARPGP